MSGKVTEIMEQRDGVREPILSDLFQVYFEDTEAWVIREAAAHDCALGGSLARMGAQSSGTSSTFLGSTARI